MAAAAAMTPCRIRREDYRSVKHDRYFMPWKILIGHTDWRDAKGSRYRIHNLPSKGSAGIYELGIVRPSHKKRKNWRRRKKKKKETIRKRDVVVVYIGRAEDVRQRLQSYGQRGSHLEGWTNELMEKWLPQKVFLSRQGPRLFSEIFARGYSLAFRWSATRSKESAVTAEQKLLRHFDYAWNKGANGARRSLDVLTKLEMQSNVVCGTRTSIVTGFSCSKIFQSKVGIQLDLFKPRDRSERTLRDVIRKLFGLDKPSKSKGRGVAVRPDDVRKTSTRSKSVVKESKEKLYKIESSSKKWIL